MSIAEGYRIELTDSFTLIYCCTCRCPFAVPEAIRSRWQERGTSFYCPNGHCQSYSDSDVQKLRRQLQRTTKEKEWAEQRAKREREARARAEYRERGQKAAKTRLKNRIKNGVCPCCTRSFENLARHIKTKHPGWKAQP